MLVHDDDGEREYAYGSAGGPANIPNRHVQPLAHGRREIPWLDGYQYESNWKRISRDQDRPRRFQEQRLFRPPHWRVSHPVPACIEA